MHRVIIQPSSPNQWCPLTPYPFKENFDEAVFSSSNSAGLRFIIRDNHSEVIWGLSMRIPLPPSIAEVEALACCRGV